MTKARKEAEEEIHGEEKEIKEKRISSSIWLKQPSSML